MTNDSIGTTGFQPGAAADGRLFDTWFDPIENAVRDQVRSFIEELIEGELEAVLARPRYGRRAMNGEGVENGAGHRHGSRTRTLTGAVRPRDRDRRQAARANTTETDRCSAVGPPRRLQAVEHRAFEPDATNTKRTRSSISASSISGCVSRSREASAALISNVILATRRVAPNHLRIARTLCRCPVSPARNLSAIPTICFGISFMFARAPFYPSQAIFRASNKRLCIRWSGSSPYRANKIAQRSIFHRRFHEIEPLL